MKIYIENLPVGFTEQDVKKLFSRYGNVESVHLEKDQKTGKPTNAAYVSMDSEVEADQAIAGLDGTTVKGARVHVTQADEAEFPTEEYW